MGKYLRFPYQTVFPSEWLHAVMVFLSSLEEVGWTGGRMRVLFHGSITAEEVQT
jgi:hypothetical protein